jgi:hypothetical protein
MNARVIAAILLGVIVVGSIGACLSDDDSESEQDSANVAACRVEDLAIRDGYYIETAPPLDDTPERVGDMWIVLANGRKPCTVTHWDRVSAMDSTGRMLPVRLEMTMGWPESEYPIKTLTVDGDSYVKFHWSNWCEAELPGPIRLILTLPGDGGSVEWTVSGSADERGQIVTPPCLDPDSGSTFGIGRGLIAGRR